MRNLLIAISLAAIGAGIFGAFWEQVVAPISGAAATDFRTAVHGLSLIHWDRTIPWILKRALGDYVLYSAGIVIVAVSMKKLGVPIAMAFAGAIVVFLLGRISYVVFTETSGTLEAILEVAAKASPSRVASGLMSWAIFALLAPLGSPFLTKN